jgi:hypothetical protein
MRVSGEHRRWYAGEVNGDVSGTDSRVDASRSFQGI